MLTLSKGLFSFSCSAGQGRAQESGREHSQDSWPKLPKGVFHIIWHHAQNINWGGGWVEMGSLFFSRFSFPSHWGRECGGRSDWAAAGHLFAVRG